MGLPYRTIRYHTGQYGTIWDIRHHTEHGTIWYCLGAISSCPLLALHGPFAPFWPCLSQFRSAWPQLALIVSHFTPLSPFHPAWFSLPPFATLWSCLAQSGNSYSIFGPFYTLLPYPHFNFMIQRRMFRIPFPLDLMYVCLWNFPLSLILVEFHYQSRTFDEIPECTYNTLKPDEWMFNSLKIPIYIQSIFICA